MATGVHNGSSRDTRSPLGRNHSKGASLCSAVRISPKICLLDLDQLLPAADLCLALVPVVHTHAKWSSIGAIERPQLGDSRILSPVNSLTRRFEPENPCLAKHLGHEDLVIL